MYVSPFPDAASGGLVLVSTDGGTEPVWAHSGTELFSRNRSNELVAVQFTEDPTFMVVREDALFSVDDYVSGGSNPLYQVSPDDREFVMLRIEDVVSDTELILVTNWFEELRQRMGN